MPEYPAELLAPGAPVVRVRVDVALDAEGVPRSVAATILPPAQKGDPETSASIPDDTAGALFRAAAEGAVSQWRCRPAWRYPRDDEPPQWVPLASRTWVTFRFDAERVDGRAAMDPRGGGRS